ncbi:hypothetical protein M569_17092 [Genlisea aurea]|uniref:Uncharacterized protein n=1 Tax=Genlisea aurea TaxID=192259 RepID=S8BZT6_9LAMI|nr:hypothetical protein M569_17092 [Genlisea aurea]
MEVGLEEESAEESRSWSFYIGGLVDDEDGSVSSSSPSIVSDAASSAVNKVVEISPSKLKDAASGGSDYSEQQVKKQQHTTWTRRRRSVDFDLEDTATSSPLHSPEDDDHEEDKALKVAAKNEEIIRSNDTETNENACHGDENRFSISAIIIQTEGNPIVDVHQSSDIKNESASDPR